VKLGSGFWSLALATSVVVRAVAAHAAEAPPAKRPVPDYDGRGGAKLPAREALWLPRVIVSPAYFVSEYVVRRPLGAGISYAERHGWPAAVSDFLALNEVHPIGVVPFFLVDFGFEPSVGLYAYWDDAGFKGHQLRLRGSTWGPHWLSLTAKERFRFGDDFEITLLSTLTKRPDFAFYGTGPDTRESDLLRYSGKTAYASLTTSLRFNGRSLLETSAGYRGASFGHTDYGSGSPGHEVSLDDAISAGTLVAPAGFREGYRAPFAGVRLALDSRGRSSRSDGARLDLSAEQSVDLANRPSSGWLRYGGTLSGFVDLNGGGRVLDASLTSVLVDPIGQRAVPFTQLASLGGGRSMPGLRSARLFDRSAMVATLRYSWPIWLALSGSLQVGVGNVFGEHFDGLRPGRARFSTAVGLETNKNRDSVFQALIGFGTETLESGAALDSIRFVIGVRNTL
jgi:opacity protein-like surface antigen